jgi:FixJ family two-component response regulator
MLTGHGDTVMAVRAMKAGAFDFIEKPAPHQELLERINEAIERSRIMHTQRVERVRFIEAQSRLSPREFEVMQGVVKGQASKAIAIALELSERTVEKHRKSIMAKMQTDSLAELIRLFILYGGEPP